MANKSVTSEAIKKVEHTPGPWAVESDEWGVNVYRKEKREHVGRLYICESVQSNADGRLIAAAPEMLEALTQLSNMYSHAWDLVNGGLFMTEHSMPRFEAAHAKAEAAIKKARGENV